MYNVERNSWLSPSLPVNTHAEVVSPPRFVNCCPLWWRDPGQCTGGGVWTLACLVWRRLSAQCHHCAGSPLHHRPVVSCILASTRGSHLVPGIVTIVASVQQTLFLATGAPPVPHTTLGTLLRHNTEGSNHELLSVYPFALHAQHSLEP